MNKDTKTWEKREDESDAAYAALRKYLDLGVERSHKKVVETLGKPSGYTRWIESWSSKYDWVKRASAWEAHLRGLEQAEAEEKHLGKLEAHRERQEEYARRVMANALSLMERIEARIEQMESEDIADGNELARLIKATVDMFKAATDADTQALAVSELLRLLADS